jgi:uncharacterized protein
MCAGEDAEAAIFGRFGNRLEAGSYDDLVARLAAVDRPVPGRTEGRRQNDRERYCIVAYLLHLAEADLLEYPLLVEKEQAPDFVVTFAGGRTRGIEVTEASTPEHQRAATQLERSPPGTLLEDEELRLPGEPLRGPGWIGDEPERQWSSLVLEAVRRKTTGYDYGAHDELELLVYDLTGVGVLVKLDDGAPFLRDAIRNWRREQGPQQVFSRISVLRDSALLFDATGRWRVLRNAAATPAYPASPTPRPRVELPHAEEVAALCRRHRIRRLSLFGSALRGEDARDSDLDLLVEFEPGVRIGYLGLAGIERELSALFGRSVDLRTPGELGPHMRERILREAETQYAAS